ncbi:hypothetical protein GCK32_019564 [Trichostrongylus colubriformis]|uniref:Phospholipase A(2) n=1 Tax=Trichostrongylus colubriformis TaxID=6319 RepID=A0AAN8EXB3_TRICO
MVTLYMARTSAWQCGIGPISSAISYAIAFPSDSVEVDKCCSEHDTLIDNLHMSREEADRLFCQCLATKDRWYIRNVVKPLFCTTVTLYTKWFASSPAKASNNTFIPRGTR